MAEGFSHTVIPTCSNPTAATYYDNVKVPKEMLVGELNGGWKLITTQLNHERIGLAAHSAEAFVYYDNVVAWAADTPAGGSDPATKRVIDVPWVRLDLARCHALLATPGRHQS